MKRHVPFILSVFCAYLFLTALILAGEAEEFPPGKIIKQVRCRDNPDQSYALYLPAQYDPQRQWPIIYAFDPGARGHLPVAHFRQGADLYGYIVVGSNNSRNYDTQSAVDASEAVWKDTHQRFSIHPKRVFTSGFSGGARVASGLAALSEQIFGVIACGAGFDPKQADPKHRPFFFFGAAGNLDMNLFELRNLDRKLDRLDVPHRIVVFEGGHQWAPSHVLTKAIEWLEIQSMKSDIVPRNMPWLQDVFTRRTTQAGTDESQGDLYSAVLIYDQILEDFQGLLDVETIQEQIARLGKNKQVRKARRDREKRFRREGEMLAKFMGKIGDIRYQELKTKQVQKELKWWRSELKKMDKMEQKASSSQEKQMIHRIRESISLGCFEYSVAYSRSKETAKFTLVNEIALLLKPDNALFLYNMACAYSLTSNTDKALDFLEMSVEKGFSNGAHMEQDPDLAPLRENPRFKEILKKLKSK